MKDLTEEHIKKAAESVFNQPTPEKERYLHLRNSHFIIIGDYFERVCTKENCEYCINFSELIKQEALKQLKESETK